METKIIEIPKFMPGQVIDISYKYKGLPNRMLIKSVYATMNQKSQQWMYEVYLESTGKYTTVDQDFIVGTMTRKSTPVYNCANIIDLYSSGWRFCGNFNKDVARETASKFATNKYIKNIILRPALDSRGRSLSNRYGIWIRYYHIVHNDGTIVDNYDDSNESIIVIK